MADKALVIFSGGQDSTTCLAWACSRYAEVRAVTFTYGQIHKREIECAQAIAAEKGLEHELLPLTIFEDAGLSTLVEGGEQHKHPGLPATFVPGRNLVFIMHAAIIAYRYKIHDLVAGMSQIDYSGYPDCRRETIDSLEKTLSLGMDYPIKVHTPLIHLNKAETVRLAQKEGALELLALTHTCYNGEYPPCGKCDACILRAKGFKEAGIEDPLGK